MIPWTGLRTSTTPSRIRGISKRIQRGHTVPLVSAGGNKGKRHGLKNRARGDLLNRSSTTTRKPCATQKDRRNNSNRTLLRERGERKLVQKTRNSDNRPLDKVEAEGTIDTGLSLGRYNPEKKLRKGEGRTLCLEVGRRVRERGESENEDDGMAETDESVTNGKKGID